jgi:RNA polymerase-binding protein DksA
MPSQKELERIQKSLTKYREKLVSNNSHMASDAHYGNGSAVKFNHMADAGSDTFEMDFSMEQMENSEAIIYDVDQALNKIEKGNYGACENCGEKITLERLRAIPFAANCIKCQEELESH